MSKATKEPESLPEEKEKTPKKTTKKREIKPMVYKLVEVVEDGDSVVFIPLPLPEGTDTSGKTPIIRAVTTAAAKGDETYDGKVITVISYPKPVKLTAKPITVKRKVTFNL